MKMEFKWLSFCGDATSDYGVSTSEPCNIGQLIDCILTRSGQNEERGDIWVSDPREPQSIYLCSYKHGRFAEPLWWKKDYDPAILDQYRCKKVIKIRANGGYGAMSYSIKIDEQDSL